MKDNRIGHGRPIRKQSLNVTCNTLTQRFSHNTIVNRNLKLLSLPKRTTSITRTHNSENPITRLRNIDSGNRQKQNLSLLHFNRIPTLTPTTENTAKYIHGGRRANELAKRPTCNAHTQAHLRRTPFQQLQKKFKHADAKAPSRKRLLLIHTDTPAITPQIRSTNWNVLWNLLLRSGFIKSCMQLRWNQSTKRPLYSRQV